jgi:hypothetical protein
MARCSLCSPPSRIENLSRSRQLHDWWAVQSVIPVHQYHVCSVVYTVSCVHSPTFIQLAKKQKLLHAQQGVTSHPSNQAYLSIVKALSETSTLRGSHRVTGILPA